MTDLPQATTRRDPTLVYLPGLHGGGSQFLPLVAREVCVALATPTLATPTLATASLATPTLATASLGTATFSLLLPSPLPPSHYCCPSLRRHTSCPDVRIRCRG